MIQGLDSKVPIVNPDGTPTLYLLQLLQGRGGHIKGAETDAATALTAAQAAQTDVNALKLRNINTGSGLAGGGNLTADRTLTLNAGIDLLTDVNTSTPAPTNGQTLVWDSATSLWKPGTIAGGGGGYPLLGTQTASSSASLNFTSLITSTYDEYLVEFVNLIPASAGAFPWIRVSTNNGSSYITSGSYNYTCTQDNRFATDRAGSETATSIIMSAGVTGSGGNAGSCGHFRIFNPLSTSVNTNFRGDTYWMGTYSQPASFGGCYTTAAATDAFQILFSTGNIASGVARLYGIPKT